MTPTPEMLALAKSIAGQFAEASENVDYEIHIALAAITAVTERAAKLAEWAHMVPPDGGSPTEDEARLAATIAVALRNFDHLKGATRNG